MKNRRLVRQAVGAALAVGAVALGTTAMAEDITVPAGQEYKDKPVISIGASEKLNNEGSVEATDSVTIDGGFFQNTGKLSTGILTISGHASDQSEIAGEIHATKEFLYKGIAGNLLGRKLTASIYTPVLHILGGGNPNWLSGI